MLDDKEKFASLLSKILKQEGYTVFQSASIREGLKVIEKKSIQVVLSNDRMPDGNALDLTSLIKTKYPFIEVIVMTLTGNIDEAVECIKRGAFHYFSKDNLSEKIFPLVFTAIQKSFLQQRDNEASAIEKHGFARILGESAAIKECVAIAEKVSAIECNVLLTGATGTGKEEFARAIHYSSNRKLKSFVAINCSAIPKNLLESELFGHAAGAFTGASKQRKGYIEEASGGTLFLDEIGEMSVELQSKLLRVLETGDFYRVGETKVRYADVRFIAATNRDLIKESLSGQFRSDIFYRLSTVTIQLPLLNARRKDIPILVNHFVKETSSRYKRSLPRITRGYMKALLEHEWKGNIRELRNVVERSVVLSDHQLEVSILPADFNSRGDEASLELTHAEARHIKKVLGHANGNKTQTAKLLGIGLTTLYKKISDYNLPEISRI